MAVFFEIYHDPFEDGTPRHPLISIELKDRVLQLANAIMRGDSLSCETDGVKEFHLINPIDENIREIFANLMQDLGIVGSIWVEYAFVTPAL